MKYFNASFLIALKGGVHIGIFTFNIFLTCKVSGKLLQL